MSHGARSIVQNQVRLDIDALPRNYSIVAAVDTDKSSYNRVTVAVGRELQRGVQQRESYQVSQQQRLAATSRARMGMWISLHRSLSHKSGFKIGATGFVLGDRKHVNAQCARQAVVRPRDRMGNAELKATSLQADYTIPSVVQ